jgi:hypothetical protein
MKSGGEIARVVVSKDEATGHRHIVVGIFDRMLKKNAAGRLFQYPARAPGQENGKASDRPGESIAQERPGVAGKLVVMPGDQAPHVRAAWHSETLKTHRPGDH